MVAANGVTFIDFGNLFQLKTHYELDQNNQPVKERIQAMVDGHVWLLARGDGIIQEACHGKRN
jgi:hypothetical protein